ncbi:MAG: TolC family protein, partial [Bacteroidota bacterium]
VAAAYLNILFSEEQLSAAQQRLAQTQAQLQQTDKLIQAGTLPANDRLEILARIANDEQSIVAAQNNVTINYLLLKQLMTMDPNTDLRIEKPEIEIPVIDPESFDFETVYMQALNTQPQIRASEMRMQSAELQTRIAKSGLYPTVGLGGNINTRWASAVRNPPTEFETVVSDPIPARINGEDGTIAFFERNPLNEGTRRSFGDQLSDFLGQSIGFSINIPIYNNHRTKIEMERAELGILTQQVQNDQIRQQLKTDVQRSIADATAAKKALEASQKTVESLRTAYDNTQKRYTLGAVNTFELTTAKTNLDNAEIDLIIARYDYLYKLKIVDFYQGNKITLK